jgi:mannose-1-phosphate guanylyltransferase
MTYHVFLLAAGFGTRLRPLTLCRPKPLLPIMGRPMIEYALHHLQKAGFSKYIVNAHHLYEHVQQWAHRISIDFNIQVDVQIETPDILGTGGGLRAAYEDLDERVLVWNGDIIADIDVKQLFDNCPLDGAAMSLRYDGNLGKTTQLMIDNKLVSRIGNLTSQNNATPLHTDGTGYHFTGIHAISKRAIESVPTKGLQCIVRTSYCELVPQQKVVARVHEGFWRDTGTPIEYHAANMDALSGKFQLGLEPDGEFQGSAFLAKNSVVEGTVEESIIGANAFVPKSTSLYRCVVWDGVQVPENGTYRNCIFYDDGILDLDLD